jgi:hypothetical protein
MQNPIWLAAGAVLAGIGFLLMRWAGRYDATGIAADAAWRMAKTRSTAGARDELGRVVDEQLAEVRADAARIGHARTAVKHGTRFFIARFMGIAGGILIAIGFAIIAVAFFWG